MKKLVMTGVAALALFGATIPTMTTPAEAWRGHGHGHGGGGLIAGAIVGLTAGALIANASRADAYEHRRWRHRCDRWAWHCNHGSDRACYAFDRECR
jgi:hypothetical protein